MLSKICCSASARYLQVQNMARSSNRQPAKPRQAVLSMVRGPGVSRLCVQKLFTGRLSQFAGAPGM